MSADVQADFEATEYDPGPPHSLEAERSVLGAILIDNAQLARVLPIVTSEDFYRERHRRIFRTMERLAASGRPIDPVTLKEALADGGDLDMVGGLVYLAGLLDGCPKSANAAYHAETIIKKARRRRLMAAAEKVERAASNGATDEDVDAYIRDLEETAKGAAPQAGLRRYDFITPAQLWPRITREIPEGALVVKAGEGGSGKSYSADAVAVSVAAGVGEWGRRAIRDPRPVVILDAENGETLTRNRVQALARGMGIDLDSIKDRLIILDGGGFDLDSDRQLGALRADINIIRPAILVLDSAAAIHQRDENSAIEIRALMDRRIRPIARDFGTAVVVLHHMRKKSGMGDLDAGAQRVRGSSGWVDGADEVLTFRAMPGLTVAVEHPKGRIGGSLPPFVLKMNLPPVGADPETATASVVDIGAPEQALSKAAAARVRILELLNEGTVGIEAQEIDRRVAKLVGCASKTVKRVRSSLEEEGLIQAQEVHKVRLLFATEALE